MLVRKPDWNSLSNLRDPQQLAGDNPLPLELDGRHPVRPERASRSETWPSWGTGRQTRRFRDGSGPQAVSLLNPIFSRYSLFPQDPYGVRHFGSTTADSSHSCSPREMTWIRLAGLNAAASLFAAVRGAGRPSMRVLIGRRAVASNATPA